MAVPWHLEQFDANRAVFFGVGNAPAPALDIAKLYTTPTPLMYVPSTVGAVGVTNH